MLPSGDHDIFLKILISLPFKTTLWQKKVLFYLNVLVLNFIKSLFDNIVALFELCFCANSKALVTAINCYGSFHRIYTDCFEKSVWDLKLLQNLSFFNRPYYYGVIMACWDNALAVLEPAKVIYLALMTTF